MCRISSVLFSSKVASTRPPSFHFGLILGFDVVSENSVSPVELHGSISIRNRFGRSQFWIHEGKSQDCESVPSANRIPNGYIDPHVLHGSDETKSFSCVLSKQIPHSHLAPLPGGKILMTWPEGPQLSGPFSLHPSPFPQSGEECRCRIKYLAIA